MEDRPQLTFMTELPPERPVASMGFMALLFYTAGILLVQAALFAIYAMLSQGRPLGLVELGFSFLSSAAWAVGAALVVRKGLVHPHLLNVTGHVPDVKGLVAIPIVAVLLLMSGTALESLVLYAFPSLFAPDPVLMRLTALFYSGPIEAALVVLLSVVIAPITEEFFFRGVVFRSLRARGHSFWVASLFTSVLFAAVHLKPIGFVTLILVSVVLTFVTERTNSLLAPMLLHGAYNLVVLAVGLTQPPQLEPFDAPGAPVPPISSLPMIVGVAAIFLFLLWLMLWAAFPAPEVDSARGGN